MSNNQNQNFPAYVESDLNKSKITKPPRIRKRERQLYIYITNRTIKEIKEPNKTLAIKTTLSKEISAQVTTPINGDIGSPKFEDVTASATWGSQINAIIYDELDLKPDSYNFVSFALLQSDTVQTSKKYRIINYQPIYDNDNVLLYANLILLPETINSFPSLDKSTWIISNNLITDKKTKFLKLTFPDTSFVYADGLKVDIIDDKNIKRSIGYKVNHVSDNLAYRFIKVRQAPPFLFDDLSMDNIQFPKGTLRSIVSPVKNLMNQTSVNILVSNSDKVRQFIRTPEKVGFLGGVDRDRSGSSYTKYFDGAFNFQFTGGNNRDSGMFIEEKPVLPADLSTFLSGGKTIDGYTVPNNEPLLVNSAHQSVQDLDVNNESDRNYFVLSKKRDLTKYINVERFDGYDQGIGEDNVSVILFSASNYKTKLLREEDISLNFIDNEPIVIEIELQIAGKSPEIVLDISGTKNFKISTYDENHELLFNDLQLETPYSFNAKDKRGTYGI